MLSLQPHPPPTLICHGLYGGILQVSPVAYSYLVAKYQMSSGPYGPIFGGWGQIGWTLQDMTSCVQCHPCHLVVPIPGSGKGRIL